MLFGGFCRTMLPSRSTYVLGLMLCSTLAPQSSAATLIHRRRSKYIAPTTIAVSSVFTRQKDSRRANSNPLVAPNTSASSKRWNSPRFRSHEYTTPNDREAENKNGQHSFFYIHHFGPQATRTPARAVIRHSFRRIFFCREGYTFEFCLLSSVFKQHERGEMISSSSLCYIHDTSWTEAACRACF